MSQPAESIFIHRLRSQLETALLVALPNEKETILQRVQVVMVSRWSISPWSWAHSQEQEQTGLGWDSFSLTYRVEAPLHSIFTEGALHSYSTISRFLWKLKRVEYALVQMRQSYPLKVRMKWEKDHETPSPNPVSLTLLSILVFENERALRVPYYPQPHAQAYSRPSTVRDE